MKKLLLVATIFSLGIGAGLSVANAADTCVVIKNGKKQCGKPMLGGVFSKTNHGWCFIYRKGAWGVHVDCANPKKVLPNGNL